MIARRLTELLVVGILAAIVIAIFLIVRQGLAPEPAATRVNLAFNSPSDRYAPVTVRAVGGGVDDQLSGKAFGEQIAQTHPSRFLYLGDVGDSGTEADFKNYKRVFGSMDDTTLPTPGDNEWGNRSEGYNLYWQKVTGQATPPWYAVRIGGWELLSLNSEDDTGPDSEQGRWLAQRLALSPKGTCRIAFWHRPRFSAGDEGDENDVAPLWDALQTRAVLVLSGHENFTERMKPDGGLTQYVIGAGGAERSDVDTADEQLAFGNDTMSMQARIDLRPRHARVRLVTNKGKTLDDRSYTCTSLSKAKG